MAIVQSRSIAVALLTVPCLARNARRQLCRRYSFSFALATARHASRSSRSASEPLLSVDSGARNVMAKLVVRVASRKSRMKTNNAAPTCHRGGFVFDAEHVRRGSFQRGK